MLRLIQVLSLAAAVTSAVTLYLVGYSTRALRAEVEAAERRIEQMTREIAVLRAERAYLARPERLEPVARRLGMVPVDGHQIELQPRDPESRR